MNVLRTILFLIGGIALIVLGIWLSIKEFKAMQTWHTDKWTIGEIKGLGIGAIVGGIFLISQAFLIFQLP